MDPLSIYPHSAVEAHGVQEGRGDGTCYFTHIIHPTQFLQFGACWEYIYIYIVFLLKAHYHFEGDLKFRN